MNKFTWPSTNFMKTCYVIKEHRAIADLVDATGAFNEGLLLTRINVPKKSRTQGIGTKLLQQICEDADREGVTLYLEVSPSDGLTADQLTAWFKRHRFRHMQAGSNVMWRPPQ